MKEMKFLSYRFDYVVVLTMLTPLIIFIMLII